jgi:hypothetical protein
MMTRTNNSLVRIGQQTVLQYSIMRFHYKTHVYNENSSYHTLLVT